ncbi:MAG TPA: elongation factor Ts [Candidatus Paceibacterota bacterium]
MSISVEDIKTLRDETGISMQKCKEALEKTNGNIDEARALLKEESGKAAAKKADREFGAGAIFTYVHATKTIGTMIELLCETDFVAKNEVFEELGNNIALHVTAMSSTEESIRSEGFVKDPETTIETLLAQATQKLGERVDIGRIARFAVLD